MGTAKLMNILRENIKNSHNIIIFGGDFVGKLDSLNELVSIHRKNDSNLTVYMTEATYCNFDINNDNNKNKSKNYNLLKSKQLYLNSKDIIIVDENNNRLIYLQNENEVDDEIYINPLMMLRFPSLICQTNLHDLHIYIIKYDMLEDFTKYLNEYIK